jgi:hypothetical protein
LAVLACCAVLWRRYAGVVVMQCVIAGFAILQIAPVFIWVFIFDGG